MILVVGASGYLGGLVCRELVKAGRPVRGLVRRTSNVEYLLRLGIELVPADLNDPATLLPAVQDCEAVIYTASAAMPSRPGENVKTDVRRARAMIDAAKGAGVNRFVFISTISPAVPEKPLFMSTKAEVEAYLKQSGLDYTILRCGTFMEVWMGLMGSASAPVTAEVGLVPTLERPYPFANRYYQSLKGDIEERGLAHITGTGRTQTPWIATADAARIAALVLDRPDARRKVFELPGATMTWSDTVRVFERVLGKPVRVKHSSVFWTQVMSEVIGLFQPAGGALMASAAWTGKMDVTPDSTQFRMVFPQYRFQTPEEFLRERIHPQPKPMPHAV
jgi:uncharacterized protein YbjT (DUF2867 family)